MIKDQAKWQLYRIRFSQAEKEREEIFAKLESCNENLKKLLQISEDDIELSDKGAAARSGETNALCRFWRHASRVFAAHCVVWNCTCRPQHSMRLLLEHRTSKSTDFCLLYSQNLENNEEARRIRIIEKGTDADTLASVRMGPSRAGTGDTSAHNQSHGESIPGRSAIETKRLSPPGRLRYVFLVNLDSVVMGPILTATQGAGLDLGHYSGGGETTGFHVSYTAHFRPL